MAKKDKEDQPKPRSIWRYLLVSLAGVSLLVFGIFAFQRTEHYLITNPKFVLAPPTDYGEDSPNLQVDGVRHASKAQIMQVFNEDFGRSIYLFPIAKRRMSLLGVQWVKDASIMRVWPNRAAVHITERTPVAFVPLKTDDPAAPYHSALIDDEGVILEPHGATQFKLPVLTGVSQNDSRDLRRAKARKMLKFFQEVGQLGDKVSEVEIASVENVKATVPMEGRAMVLVLGGQRFSVKLQNFFKHYPEIRKRLPDATVLDLRIEDRITAIEGGNSDQ
jgi:cell division protein FtsQ